MQIPDEPAHFGRILQLSRGEIFPIKIDNQTGGYFSKNISNQLRLFGEVPFHGTNKVSRSAVLSLWQDLPELTLLERSEFVEFSNMALYNPVVYLPSIMSVSIGRILNLNYLSHLYLARVFSWIIAFFALSYCISILDFHRKTQIFFALGFLTPIGLSQFASISADSLSFAFSAICIALTIRAWQFGIEKIFWPKLILIALCLSLSKLVYFSIALLPLLLLLKYREKKNLHYAVLLILAAVFPTLIWAILIKTYYSPIRPGIDPDAQLAFLKSEPFALFHVIKIHFTQQWKELLSTYTGKLGWLDTPIRFSFEYALILTIASFLSPKEKLRLSFSYLATAWATLCALLFILLIYFSIYLSFNPIGQSYMEGMTGRYLIPAMVILFLFLPSLSFAKRPTIHKIYYGLLGLCFLFIHVKAYTSLWKRFWIP
ncbi:MAG: DUF2142 domain-containing protein [Oligoflexia bacterium]|nr:DUF2142 domain-containing protein [Oligoflexia bacterium]